MTTSVTVKATYNGTTKSTSVTLAPSAIAPTLSAISVNPGTVKGGSPVAITITLSGPAPTGGSVITLSSTNSALSLPTSVEMTAGGTTGILKIQTSAVKASTTGRITVSAGGATQTANITVTP